MSEIGEFTRHLGHYLGQPDVALVTRAFDFSESAHRGQFRKSGEPYITHPLAVASILSQWRLDAQGLAAALLHDVMEDTTVTKTELESKFGKPVDVDRPRIVEKGQNGALIRGEPRTGGSSPGGRRNDGAGGRADEGVPVHRGKLAQDVLDRLDQLRSLLDQLVAPP